MIKNNIEVDVKVKCIENGTTQAQLAETIGTTGQYVNRIIKKQDGVVNLGGMVVSMYIIGKKYE